MSCVKSISHNSPLLLLLVLPCMFAGSVSASEDVTWPFEAKLMIKDWEVDTPDAWMEIGDVEIFNTKWELKANIYPYEGYKIKNVSIHVVQDPADLDSILGKDGKPRPNRFDHKTDYLGDEGILVDEHHEVIPLDDFEICWGANPERCPPDLYFVVHVELQEPQLVEIEEGASEEVWVDLPEQAYAEGVGTFPRLDRDDGSLWGYYKDYQVGKVEPGHFIDAVVNGLGWHTATQSGITGDAGQFWYLPEEQVHFYAGSLYLGDAQGDRGVSPLDLFEGSGMDDDRVLNVARLLQSLDGDGNPAQGAINLTEPVIACLEEALVDVLEMEPEEFFGDDELVEFVIYATAEACADEAPLTIVSKEDAAANLDSGLKAGNLLKRNVSKTPDLKSDKAKLEILPVYVPARRSDGSLTEVVYHDADDNVIETRGVAKPIAITYLDEIENTGAFDVFLAISRDDGSSFKRRNLSKTADKSSLLGYPGDSWKPMMKVKDNMIFVAWTDKYCRGGRPGYAITVCPDLDGDSLPDPCEICRETEEGTVCRTDYPGDDAYWQDDLFGVAGPQRSVIYEEFPEMGERPYSCAWTARAVVEPDGNIQWFKPERVSSGRRDAYQLFAAAATDVGFAIVWQEDPKGLRPGEGEGPGDGWSGARSNNKTDIWYSYITLDEFGLVDYDYPASGPGHDNDVVDWDPDLAGRVKALVPMSMPVRISDNDVCSLENMNPSGGNGEHDYDEEGQGTHRYCGTLEDIGTAETPGNNPRCAYTVEKANPKGEIHNVCVTADGRLLDGNTGASRANVFLQPYKKQDGAKSAWAIIGYEESKGVGIPPDGDEHDCDTDSEDEHDTKYKPDEGKNVIYHSFDFTNPQVVDSGGILNLPETDGAGIPVYVVDEFGALLLDWKGDPQLAYENARRVRFITQPKSKKGPSGTVLVALYRQGEEGKGKPADIFMRRAVASQSGNPYGFANFVPGAQNVSSVEVTEEWQNPFDLDKPVKMLRWTWSPVNLADKSARNPRIDAKAQRGALNGDDLLIGYSWTPNWGRSANDKYDFYVRRSFNGGQAWTTDPHDLEPIEHEVTWRVPVIDEETQTVGWTEEVVSMAFGPGDAEPPRNVSKLRNNRTSVLEPRLVKTPGTIKDSYGNPTGYPEDIRNTAIYQVAYGLEFNQNQMPDDVEYPKMPLDIFYGRTRDKGQRYESVVVTPQGGAGKTGEGWNLLAKDTPEQGAAQLRQTPDGSRLYGIWLEEGEKGSDIMFRRVDYR